MICCTKCGSANWTTTFKCHADPANDTFKCRDCGHTFKRYNRPEDKKAPADK